MEGLCINDTKYFRSRFAEDRFKQPFPRGLTSKDTLFVTSELEVLTSFTDKAVVVKFNQNCTMDYQHLYTYLDSRPVEELQDCVSNIVHITRKRSPLVDANAETEEAITLRADDALLELTRLRTVQRVWIQQAVWNKFGPNSDALPSDHEMSRLLLEPKVTSFIARINQKIDNEITISNCDKSVDDETAPATSVVCEKTPFPVWENRSSLSATSSLTGTLSPNPEIGSKRKRGDKEESKNFKWTVSMDDALRNVMRSRTDSSEGPDWSEVANRVGFGLTKHQCRTRWKYELLPREHGAKTDSKWSPDEVAKLHELVQQYSTLPPHWRKGQQSLSENRIDWTAIGAELGRVPNTCNRKWISIRHKGMKTGTFSLTEDKLIEQRVTEWGDKGIGLWSSLEKEMNRPNGALAHRWERLRARTGSNY